MSGIIEIMINRVFSPKELTLARGYLEEEYFSSAPIAATPTFVVLDASWVKLKNGEDKIVTRYIAISDEMVPDSYTVDGKPPTDELGKYFYTYRKVWFYPGEIVVEWWYEE